MRVLILSCNTGEGHNSAAKAIKESFDRKNIDCDIHNALLFLSEATDKIISGGHVFIYRRLPKLFGVGYKFEEKHPPEFIVNALKFGVEKLYDFLSENHYDSIICVHVFAAIMVNEMKKAKGFDIHTSFVSTDYTCCPGAYECNADIFFTPHPLLHNEFKLSGIDEKKLIASGIPVKSQFESHLEKDIAKKLVSLPSDKKIILIGCGSMGCGPVEKLSQTLQEFLPDNFLAVVACGRSKKLYKSLEKENYSKILPIAFTDKMSLYMDACDLYLTKAGGLSTTEAIIKEVPLIYINAVPGCETRNIDFMTSNNFAKAAFSPKEAAIFVLQALTDLESAKEKICECRSMLPKSPSDFIADFTIGLVK